VLFVVGNSNAAPKSMHPLFYLNRSRNSLRRQKSQDGIRGERENFSTLSPELSTNLYPLTPSPSHPQGLLAHLKAYRSTDCGRLDRVTIIAPIHAIALCPLLLAALPAQFVSVPAKVSWLWFKRTGFRNSYKSSSLIGTLKSRR